MAEIRYIGKNGGPPKPRKPTAEQKEREASDARLASAKAREREAIATLRETELARKRGELVEQKAVVRYVAYAYTCIKERLRALPSAATRKHATKMAIDAKIREALNELADNLDMSVREYQERVERA
jgi:type IV secretory pathway VirB10-like protein